MEISGMLRELCMATGVSGYEYGACAVAEKLLKNYTDDVKTDKFGCVTAFIGDRNNGKPTVMLEAHIDEIGFILTYIDDDGFLRVGKCGGTDSRLYAAQSVTVHSENGDVKGVVCTLPPHVNSDSSKAMKLEDVAIDIGFDKEQAEKHVSFGDRITIDSVFSELSGSRVSCKAIDDRAGAAAVLYALELTKDKEKKFNIEVLFASEEEVGSRGAIISAYNSEADYVIATDVSFAYTPDAKKEKCGEMGKGAMIGISPVLDKMLTSELITLSEKAGIPYQFEVMGGDTGTDADEISVSHGGIRTALVSIPIKYMHTPVEVVDLDDIAATGRIMAEFITGGKENV